MTKVKHAVSSRRHRKKVLKAAKGRRGSGAKLYRIAKESVRKGKIYSYGDRKKKKRDYRSMWIVRISAACKENGISYSRFISALKKNEIDLNRKVLADMALNDSAGFKALVKKAKI